MMYEAHFKLSGAPFKLNPDTKFFFGSRSHNKAMAYLHYGLKQAEGFIVITGPIGSGKTMVISQLLDQLSASNVVAAQLLTSNIEPEELLDHILSAFRIEPEGEGRTGKLEAFEDYLFDQLNRGRRVLLIMDEAQNLPFETLEELRMLSNLDYDGTPLFQVFLVGQPEFREIMQSERLEQLRQRVIASYHLENLSLEETREYIHHRLAITGWREDPIFSDSAVKSIFTETGGRPRRINTVCNRIMLYCSLEDKHEVTGPIADQVISELHDEELDARDTPEAAAKRPKDKMPEVKSIEPDEVRHAPVEDDDESSSQPVSAEVDVENNESANEVTDVAGNVEMDTDQPKEESTGAEEPELAEEEAKSEESAASAEDAPSSSEAAATDATDADNEMPSKREKQAGGASVFDRVRAKRSGAPGDASAEATLEDVASAIAKASVGELADDAARDGGDAAAEKSKASKSAESPERRRQHRHSIDEVRGDLKDANASVRQLKRSLADLQQHRNDTRKEISAGLKRAESLLREVAKRWS